MEPMEKMAMHLAEDVFRRLDAKAKGGGMKRPVDEMQRPAMGAGTKPTDAPGGN